MGVASNSENWLNNNPKPHKASSANVAGLMKGGDKMAKVILGEKLTCKRCGHTWLPRKEDVMTCPGCRSPYWNIPRKTDAQGVPIDLKE